MAADDDTALEAILDRLDALDADDDRVGLRTALGQALAAFPDDPTLRRWTAVVAADDERFDDAVIILDDLLAADAGDHWARRERASALIELGRFADALTDLRALTPRDLAREERADFQADLALCLDRLGHDTQADAAFRAAARLDPSEHPMPPRLSPARFDALVAEALDTLPERFQALLRQVVVTVQAWPAPDDPDPFLLGLYVGVPRSQRTLASMDNLDHVVVFKRAHELGCHDDAELRREVRRTVVHELAHHFGLDHDEMGDYL